MKIIIKDMIQTKEVDITKIEDSKTEEVSTIRNMEEVIM
jgi:hypothetical protein